MARDRYPEIGVDLVFVGDHPGAALASGAVDLVVGIGRPSGAVSLIELFQDELVVATSTDHPLAGRDWIDAAELEAETYLTYNPNPTPGFEYDRFIRPTGVYPRVVTVVEQDQRNHRAGGGRYRRQHPQPVGAVAGRRRRPGRGDALRPPTAWPCPGTRSFGPTNPTTHRLAAWPTSWPGTFLTRRP